MGRALAGLGVLVTRQADELAARINREAGKAFVFPTVRSAPIALSTESKACLAKLNQYDFVIFISPAAVRFAAAYLHPTAFGRTRLAAVGPGTADALARLVGLPVLHPPSGTGSEALLAVSQLQTLTDKRVLIVRGRGGRAVLAAVLRERGASVDYAEIYERTLPAADPAPLRTWIGSGAIDAVIVTSPDALENLVTLCGGELRARIDAVQLVVSSERMVKIAADIGLRSVPIVAADAGEDALFAALAAWAGKRNG